MVRFIHTSDLQLGKPFRRFPDSVRGMLSEARLEIIDTIGTVANAHSAKHVLVAGDVFDNVDPGDRVLIQALSRMGRSSVRWWLMPGNHDHGRADGLWARVMAKAPDNVFVLDTSATVELEDGAWVLPAPLEFRRTREDPTSLFSSIATPSGAIRIGLAHGSIAEFGGTSDATNLIPPDRAQTSGLDYLALGDWHGHLIVNDRTAYSGAPEVDRFGRDDLGSVIVADVRAGEPPRLERVQTGRFQWLSRNWEITCIEDFQRELAGFHQGIDPARTLLDLRLSGAVSLSDRVAIMSALDDGLSHELRWLSFTTDQLIARPTADDLANIDIQGTLSVAAATLQAKVEADGPDASLARLALERLYVEALRVNDGAAR